MATTITYTLNDDIIYAGSPDATFRGLAGNDVYYVDNAVTGTLVISDDEGINTIRLANGLSITSSTVYNNACQLTLSSGAVLQILNCDSAGTQFDLGGTITGAGTVVDYNKFVTETLGTEVPAEGEGPNTGGSKIIGQDSGDQYILTTSKDTITGTDGDDTVYGVITGDAKGLTFQAYDAIDTDGGHDTFNLTLDDASYYGDGNVSNVEVLNIRATGAAKNMAVPLEKANAPSDTFHAGGFTGLTHIYSDRSDSDLNIADMTDLDITVGLKGQNVQDLTVTYLATAVSGANDTVTVDLQSAGMSGQPDVTITNTSSTNGVENLVVNATGTDASAVDELEATNSDDTSTLQTLTVTGDQKLTVNDAINFANTSGVFDATANTGGVDVKFTDGDDVKATGGAGNDSFDFAGGLTKADTLDGGAGTDTLSAITAGSTKMTDYAVSNIEVVNLTPGADATVDFDGFKDFQQGNLMGTANGFETSFLNIGAGVATGLMAVSDAAYKFKETTFTLKDSEGTSDTFTMTLDSKDHEVGVSLVDGNSVNINGVETVNLISTGALSSDKAHDLNGDNDKGLAANKMTTLNISGDSALLLNVTSDNSALTKVDASTMTGALSMGLKAETNINILGGSGDDRIGFTGQTINNNDTVDGGAGKDILYAEANELTALTGKLNVSNVETINLEVDAHDSTVDFTNVTGAETLCLIDGNAANTYTVNNLAASTAIEFGNNEADGMKGTIKVIPATGQETINQTFAFKSTANDNDIDVALKMDNVTTATFAQSATQNSVQVNAADLKAANIVVTGGQNGKVLDLTDGATKVFNAATTSLDTTAATSAVKASFANATSGVTVNANLGFGDNSVIGSAKNDTFTVTNYATADTLTGGDGTDSLAVSISEGTGNLSNITGFETYALSSDAGVSLHIVNLGGIDAATTTAITISGGSSGTTFQNNAGFSHLDGLKTLDASGYQGSVDLLFSDTVLTSAISLTGGAGEDNVYASYGNTADFTTNNALKISAVENMVLDIDAHNATIDFTNITGMNKVQVRSGAGDAGNLTLDKFDSATTIELGSAGTTISNIGVTVNLASATGTADALNLSVVRSASDGTGPAITAAGVEVLNVSASTTVDTDNGINLANVSATGTGTIAATFTGGFVGKDLIVADINADVATIDATGYQGDFVMGGRAGTSAMTINTGTGADSIIMQNSADALNAGTGADTLDINYNGVVGSLQIDLNASGDQVSVFNGLTNAAVQTGFVNADLSGYTGGNGAEISANAAGSSIIGTGVADQINCNVGADTIAGGAGADSIVLTGDSAIDIVKIDVAADYGDIVTGFKVGNGGDAWDLNVAVSAAGYAANAGAAALDFGTNGVNVVTNDSANTGNSMSAAQITTAAISAFDNIDANETAYIAVTADTDAASTVYIYHCTANAAGDALASVAFVAQMDAVICNSITAANFDGFGA